MHVEEYLKSGPSKAQTLLLIAILTGRYLGSWILSWKSWPWI